VPATQTPPVLMYSTAWCPYCMRARSLLERNGVEYLDIPVDEEPELREQMVARSGGLRTVPQIFIGERHVGGFDELHALERAGELEQMLGTK
jgi:glutaredoxin 3